MMLCHQKQCLKYGGSNNQWINNCILKEHREKTRSGLKDSINGHDDVPLFRTGFILFVSILGKNNDFAG